MTEIDYEAEVGSFEAGIGALRAGARSCVARFRSTTDENLLYLLAERLGGLGSLAVPALYELVLDDRTASPSHRYLAARVVVELGDRGPAIEQLCAEVGSRSSYALPAANVLARLGLAEGRDPVTAAIVHIDPDPPWELVDWALALLDLGGTLPVSVRAALESRRSHAGARLVLDQADAV